MDCSRRNHQDLSKSGKQFYQVGVTDGTKLSTTNPNQHFCIDQGTVVMITQGEI